MDDSFQREDEGYGLLVISTDLEQYGFYRDLFPNEYLVIHNPDSFQDASELKHKISCIIIDSPDISPDELPVDIHHFRHIQRLFPRVPLVVYMHMTQGLPTRETSPPPKDILLYVNKNDNHSFLLNAVHTCFTYYRQIQRNQKLTGQLTELNRSLETLIRFRTQELDEFQKKKLSELERRNEFIERELDKARKIQSALLPPYIPEYSGCKFSLLYLPMEKVGGDLYGFVEFHNGDLGIFIADVSGHGIPAAFIASMAKLQFDYTAPMISSPAETLYHLNLGLQNRTGGNFLTVFYAILKESGQMLYARAGHSAPLIFRRSRNELEELSSPGRVLGLFPELQCEDGETHFNEGDRLVLFTDGLTEARNDTLYGDERLKNIILKTVDKPGQESINLILEDIETFTGNHEFEDDVTLIIVDRVAQKEK